jgi:hypothetical protein
MNAERKKILELLVEGKITADDANKLLDKLSGSASSGPEFEARTGAGASAGTKPDEGCSPKPRFMRIVVDKPGQDQVNVRMPMAFVRTGTNLLAVLPSRVREKLAEQGIDIAAVAAMGAAALDNINIDVEKGDGKKVKIFCE